MTLEGTGFGQDGLIDGLTRQGSAMFLPVFVLRGVERVFARGVGLAAASMNKNRQAVVGDVDERGAHPVGHPPVNGPVSAGPRPRHAGRALVTVVPVIGQVAVFVQPLGYLRLLPDRRQVVQKLPGLDWRAVIGLDAPPLPLGPRLGVGQVRPMDRPSALVFWAVPQQAGVPDRVAVGVQP